MLSIELPDVAIGAIVAALIAGSVSLLGLIVAKEQKVSDFRQAWIDALRSELASLIAHANAIHGSLSVRESNAAEAWKNTRDDFVGINEAAGKIRLRLNPSEPASQRILSTIEEIERLLGHGSVAPGYAELNRVEKRLIDEASLVLKSEWRRVKRGEMTYRVAKWVAIIVVALPLVGGVLLAISAAAIVGAQKAAPALPTP